MTAYEVQRFLIALAAITGTEYVLTLHSDGSGAVDLPFPDPSGRTPFGTFDDTGGLRDYLNDAVRTAVEPPATPGELGEEFVPDAGNEVPF